MSSPSLSAQVRQRGRLVRALRRVGVLLVVLALSLVGAVSGPACPAYACSCADWSTQKKLGEADAVATTVVESMTEITPGEHDVNDLRYVLRVTKVYKGDLPERIELETSSQTTACGLGRRTGEMSIIAGKVEGHEHRYTMGWCSYPDERGLTTQQVFEREFGPGRDPKPGGVQPTQSTPTRTTPTHTRLVEEFGEAKVYFGLGMLSGVGLLLAVVALQRRRHRSRW